MNATELEETRSRIQAWLSANDEARGVTIPAIAKATGMNKATLYDARSNAKWNPTFDTMRALLRHIPERFSQDPEARE